MTPQTNDEEKAMFTGTVETVENGEPTPNGGDEEKAIFTGTVDTVEN